MSHRMGVARVVSTGLLGAALIATALAACGDDSSPGAAAPGSGGDGGGSNTAVVPDASTEPPPAAPEGDAGSSSGGSGFELPFGGPNPVRVPLSGDCNPGQTQPCQRDLLCTGVATCNGEGSGFGECECDAKPAASVGIVGARCVASADCAGGATCVRADGNGYRGAGGPAGGYCTFPCEATPDCQALDSESRCVPLGPNDSLYCIRTCQSKDAEPGEAKCLNRSDLACVSIAADGVEPIAAGRQEGYCAPRCGSDEECPAGRVCHRQGGICTDAPAPGAPTGSRCELTTNCDGRECEDRIDGVGTCTALCVLGSLSGCGYGHESTLRKAACLTPLVAAGRFSEGPGDLGLCRELCDVDGDCLRAAEGFVCRPINPELAAFTGRSGACARAAN